MSDSDIEEFNSKAYEQQIKEMSDTQLQRELERVNAIRNEVCLYFFLVFFFWLQVLTK